MSHELTPLEVAKAAAVEARQDTQTLEVIRLLMEQQTAQIQRDTEQAKAMSAALALAQQQPRKGASDRAWLVLAALGGGAVLVCLFLALSVAAVAVAVTAPVAVKAVRELRKDSK
ncbi:hypothetical protein [Streptomyces sp. NPDC048350]|uniref:hypothetical protein n=1 Tax=Streptomyces sp. NPDC048350 TaxID=3365538 RepID=UPI00372237CE